MWWMKPLSCLKPREAHHTSAELIPHAQQKFGVSPSFLKTCWSESGGGGGRCSTVLPCTLQQFPTPTPIAPTLQPDFCGPVKSTTLALSVNQHSQLYWRDSGSLIHLVTPGWLKGQVESSVGSQLLSQGWLWLLPVKSVRDVAGNSYPWSLLCLCGLK